MLNCLICYIVSPVTCFTNQTLLTAPRPVQNNCCSGELVVMMASGMNIFLARAIIVNKKNIRTRQYKCRALDPSAKIKPKCHSLRTFSPASLLSSSAYHYYTVNDSISILSSLSFYPNYTLFSLSVSPSLLGYFQFSLFSSEYYPILVPLQLSLSPLTSLVVSHSTFPLPIPVAVLQTPLLSFLLSVIILPLCYYLAVAVTVYCRSSTSSISVL